jgi:hypothetical protein
LWDDCGDAQTDVGAQIEPDWDLALQPTPDFEVDLRLSCLLIKAAILMRCEVGLESRCRESLDGFYDWC